MAPFLLIPEQFRGHQYERTITYKSTNLPLRFSVSFE